MKKSLLTIIMFAFISSLFAQNSNLIIFSDQGEAFTMYLNGIQQNQKPVANVKAIDLNADFYKVRLEFNNKSIPTLDKSVWFETPGMEYTFNITQKKNGKYALRPVSQTAIAESTDNSGITESDYETPGTTTSKQKESWASEPTGEKPSSDKAKINVNMTGTSMDVNVDDENGEQVDVNVNFDMDENMSTQTTTTTSTNGNPDNIHVNMDVNETEMDENIEINMSIQGSGTQTSTSTTTTTTTTSTSTNAGNTDYYESMVNEENETISHSGNCNSPMSSFDFDDAKTAIDEKTFDDSKITLAKQITRANCLSSDQVRDIMKALDYEDSRLEYAKFAYDYVYDPNNYYKVNSAFEFEMTIEELEEFLENK
ncbi:MAG: DUF4476 domain-containing protein [Bacteroidales bacterium]|jgi:hypothetical protein|nr:DUF4476 domain-containing protein [Bacteroidales bacterium]